MLFQIEDLFHHGELLVGFQRHRFKQVRHRLLPAQVGRISVERTPRRFEINHPHKEKATLRRPRPSFKKPSPQTRKTKSPGIASRRPNARLETLQDNKKPWLNFNAYSRNRTILPPRGGCSLRKRSLRKKWKATSSLKYPKSPSSQIIDQSFSRFYFQDTSTYDPSSADIEAQPSNRSVRSTSSRKISRARATPACPAAASPYA
jgi:hypothetical protein